MKKQPIPKPLYKQGKNEVWDAKEYLRAINMTSSQYLWFLMGAIAVCALMFVSILLVVTYL